MKSPLRYPGGKSRAVKHLLPFIPEDINICSPFIGGGSLEIALSERGQLVNGYDAFEPLVNFWDWTLKEPQRLAQSVTKYFPLPKNLFYQIQKRFFDLEGIEQATAFFVLNRSSFSGTTLSWRNVSRSSSFY